MVSGLEIAGVILASIPLIISALEHHGKGVTMLRVLCEYERGIRVLVRGLRTELDKFQDVCKALLFSSMPPLQIDFILRNPLAGPWRDARFKKSILARLGKSSVVFDVSVTNIHKALDLMKGQMEHSPSDKSGFLSRKRLICDDIMSTIVANVTELQGLANGLRKAEPELPTPAAMSVSNDGWSKMRNIRNLSSNNLAKVLSTTLRRSSRENLGTALESTQIAKVAHEDRKTMVTRILVLHVGISFRKRGPVEGGEIHEPKLNKRQTWQETIKRGTKGTLTQAALELPSPHLKIARKRRGTA
ncbi:hypothetical protein QBC34DRAFT_37370 [Podospora aff. communis PSN243]|uniref:Fungal N-terminal domain-containing protein n=1 Tax=Podospora aff. communis PSN243 TaxID=3040156 RepID=A0AAV9FZI7_9PEZI|nr:hypothetical protein QBC34DRAFT_37370 [Podospora aff. communis PSN243]